MPQLTRLSSLICGLSSTALFLTSAPANAQRAGQFESELQSVMHLEAQARASNTPREWCSVGQSWLNEGTYASKTHSSQDWVKETQNPATRELSVAVMKRAIACFLKAYELEGVHDTPASRERSDALRNLLKAYQSLTVVDPNNADWHYLRGEALCAKGLYKQAQPELKRAQALGGAGGTKASALAAHVKPFLANQLAGDQQLWRENEKRDQYNASHYVAPSPSHYVNFGQLEFRRQTYQNGHPGADPHASY